MILPDKKLIFVHIPRTGGTIIEKSMTNKFTEKHNYHKHFSAYDYKWAYPEEWESYFKFGFVRNPFDWVVSFAYRYNMSPDTLVSYLETNPMYYAHCHSGPRWGQKIPFYNILEGVDFVGKFENLEKDYKYLQEKFNLPPMLEEKIKVTEGRKPNYQYYYDDSLYERVAKIFKKDIEKYEYSF